MDHFKYIYTQQAVEYHQMITAEDPEGNLFAAMQQITPWPGKRVLDLGTGTGRIPLLFARYAALFVGLDLHGDMLRQNRIQCDQNKGSWLLVQGDIRRLPLPHHCFDIITASWVIGHFTDWYTLNWQPQIEQVLQEMHRVVAPRGTLIIVETLTTGSETPVPPNERLAAYYAWIESEWGFSRQIISSDMVFGSPEEAARRTEFFFGAEFADTVRANQWARIPEWTGVWSKQL